MVKVVDLNHILNMQKTSTRRINELDALRGLAALAVVFFHYTTFEVLKEATNTLYEFKYGLLGVHLFFMISGFVIFMTIQKVKSSFEFVYKRFIRLYPVFWVCLIFTFIITSVGGIDRYERTTTEFLINFTMIPSLLKTRFIDGAYWSLAPEILFYTFIWVVYRLRFLSKIEIICLIWLICSYLLIYSNISSTLSVLLNVKYSFLFIAGINFYKLFTKSEEKERWINHFVIISSLLFCFLTNPVMVTFFCICFYIIFYLFIYNKLSFLGEIKAFLFLGTISYPLYLIHQFFGYVIINKLVSFGMSNYLLLLIIPIGLSCFIAFIITKYIEKPILRRFRNKKLYRSN